MQIWLKEKLFLKAELKKNFKEIQESFVTDSKDIPNLLFRNIIFLTLLLPSTQVRLRNQSSYAWTESVSGQLPLPGSEKGRTSNLYGK